MSLAIVIPTTGRVTLGNTLESVASQLLSGDHVIVVADLPPGGRRDYVRRLVHQYAVTDDRHDRGGVWTFACPPEQLGCWGHPARNVALNVHVDTTHVCTIDDDDVYLPGALDAIHGYGCWDKPVVFKARWGAGHPAAGVTLWHRPEVLEGNVATPMVVWPAAARARFGLRYAGDFDFFCDLAAEYGSLCWDEREIVAVRPVALPEAA